MSSHHGPPIINLHLSSSGEEEEEGPSVDSNDQDERIAARRLRIARRVELARRIAMGEDLIDKKEVKEEQSKSRKQMEDSRIRLTKLHKDGFELVTNIRVAGDSREANRRAGEEEARRIRKEKLEQEAKMSSERFDDITKKWETALQKEVPQALHEMLVQQKRSCDLMNEEKHKLITDFQQELKLKDDQYVRDLKKMAEDVDLLIERMDEQISNVTRAHSEELDEIERAFVAERNDLLELQRKRWEEKMQLRQEKEDEYMNARLKRVEDYEQQLQQLRVQDAEEYNLVKIRLETDVQILEQQLQQMRATYQLNQEKLEYNFQVLKKRDEENTITKSQQKRKITRMQDVLNVLRTKLAKQEKQYKDENHFLTEDYKRITEHFKDLQKKSKHFLQTDADKFYKIWCMNEEELKEILFTVIDVDKVIQKQQLGLPWVDPDISFTANVGPLTGKMARVVKATEIVRDVLLQTSTAADKPEKSPEELEEEERRRERAAIFSSISAHTIRKILDLLSDESGFLLESKLRKLLQPLEKDDKALIKLDAIFSALGVETEDDIHKLASYFMHLREEVAAPEGESAVPEQEEQATEDVDPARSSSQKSQTDQKPSEQSGMQDECDAEVGELTGQGDKGDPVDLIHPNEVLKALRAFVEDHHEPSKDKGFRSQFRITALDHRDWSEDSEYWLLYSTLLTEGRERVWDGLLAALEKYNEVLHGRARLLNETDALRTQNAELRLLLHQYVNSKVNDELQVPPTRVLKMHHTQGLLH